MALGTFRVPLAPSTNIQIALAIGFWFDWLPSGFLFSFLRPRCIESFRDLTLSLFNQGGELDGAIIRNFDVWRGASNAHGCDGSVDLHVASLRYLASDKSERSFAKVEQRRVGLPVRVVHELVQSHVGVFR